VNALPPAWLEPPVIGEIFESFEECEQCLYGYSLSKGFNIVRTGVLRAATEVCKTLWKHYLTIYYNGK